MKVLVKIFIFVGILYASFSVQAGLRAEDVNAILKHYGYGHLEYKDGQLVEKVEDDKDCGPRVDQWGGRMFKAGVWGPDVRRSVDLDESTLPPEQRLKPSEKKQLTSVGAVLCSEGSKDIDGTGFIVDIDILGAKSNRDYEIIATSSHVMFNPETGVERYCEYLPDYRNTKEYYRLTPVNCGSKKADEFNNGFNNKDWCLAKVEKKISIRHGKMEIEFSDKEDWEDSERNKNNFLTAGWRKDTQRIEVASNCAPDDKKKYLRLLNRARIGGHDLRGTAISDCHTDEGASGGPFLSRNQGKLRAIGITKGSIGQQGYGTYNPDEGRASLFIRFTEVFREEFKKAISKIESI